MSDGKSDGQEFELSGPDWATLGSSFVKLDYGIWQGFWLGITFTPLAGDEPNWFRRVMTSWAFGVKWKKVKPDA